jgi:hypothetical protein
LIVYTTGEKAVRQKSFMVCICPARHLEGKGEMPADWVSDKNEPIEFNVEFVYGKAEVSDSIGKYMIKHQLAARSKLIIPDAVQLTA